MFSVYYLKGKMLFSLAGLIFLCTLLSRLSVCSILFFSGEK